MGAESSARYGHIYSHTELRRGHLGQEQGLGTWVVGVLCVHVRRSCRQVDQGDLGTRQRAVTVWCQ